jgi:branched-chain amino acid transport system permease protein
MSGKASREKFICVVAPEGRGTEFFLMAMVMLAIGGMGAFIVVIGNQLLRSFDEYRLLLWGAVVLTVMLLPNGVSGLFRKRA